MFLLDLSAQLRFANSRPPSPSSPLVLFNTRKQRHQKKDTLIDHARIVLLILTNKECVWPVQHAASDGSLLGRSVSPECGSYLCSRRPPAACSLAQLDTFMSFFLTYWKERCRCHESYDACITEVIRPTDLFQYFILLILCVIRSMRVMVLFCSCSY